MSDWIHINQFLSINPELTIINIYKPNPNYPIYNAFRFNSIDINNEQSFGYALQFNNNVWDITPPSLLYTNFYSCDIRNAGNQLLPTNTLTQLEYPNIVYDPSGMADVINDRITILHAGKYMIILKALISGSSTGTLRLARITKNGSVISEKNSSGSTYFINYFIVIVEQCEINDVIEGFGEHDAGISLGYSNSSQARFFAHLQVMYIGE